MATKTKTKAVKSKTEKSRKLTKPLKSKKTVKSTVKSPAKKPAPKAKAVKKPTPQVKTVKTAKKPAPVAKQAKATKKTAPVAAKLQAVQVAPAVKAVKVKVSRKKPTKMDKKMARTLVKIANANKTAVATVTVQSAAMAAVRATMALAAANANQPQHNTHAAAANTNQQAAAKAAAAAKGEKPAFKTGDVVVYPAHGVGKVAGVEAHTIGGQEIKLFRITFDHERMTLKVPVARATGSGLRQLSSRETMKNAFETMKGRPRVRRVMWSRRAQEYEQKINSGDPVAIAEVLRDLRRNAESGDQSYSERQIFQNALERLAREVAAIEKIDQEIAVQKLSELLLRKAPPVTLPEPANNDSADAA